LIIITSKLPPINKLTAITVLKGALSTQYPHTNLESDPKIYETIKTIVKK